MSVVVGTFYFKYYKQTCIICDRKLITHIHSFNKVISSGYWGRWEEKWCSHKVLFIFNVIYLCFNWLLCCFIDSFLLVHLCVFIFLMPSSAWYVAYFWFWWKIIFCIFIAGFCSFCVLSSIFCAFFLHLVTPLI